MMQADKVILQGQRVWVTRPQDQADKLIDLIQKAGAQPFHFPVIEIREAENREQQARALQNLEEYYALIFISRNAVTHAFRLVPGLSKTIKKSVVIAVGAGTQEELSQHGLTDVIVGASGTGSEAVLELPVLQTENIRDKKIMIVRGQGGRELLKDSLSERGAQIDYTEVYRRILPRLSQAESKKVWQENRPDVIVVTSTEGLHNLLKLINKEVHKELFNTPLVVASGRIQEEAKTLGFIVTPYIEENVSDEGLLRAVAHSFENE